MPHSINPKKCAVCGACEFDCPTGAISIVETNDCYRIDASLCTDCGDCVDVCPTEAITKDEQDQQMLRPSSP